MRATNKYSLLVVPFLVALLFSCVSTPEQKEREREATAVRQEIEVGKAALAKISGQYGVIRDRKLTEFLGYYLQSLAQYTERQGLAYRAVILASEQVNAYALPGGYIAVTLGALKQIREPAELAGILAHELGHVNKRHILNHVKIQVEPDFFETLGRIIAGSRMVITGAINQINEGIAERLFLEGYAAEQEYEADAYALDLLQSLGLDAAPYKRFLERLDAGGASAERENLDKTHPPLATRLAKISPQLETGMRLLEKSPEFTAFLTAIAETRIEQ